MARFRLRFLLQEIDLPRGETLIGRSPDCHVTIEDPLVSRQHARIVTDDEGARVEDIKSRNGVKVNGAPMRGPTRLRDGDRIRIGTQELVFCETKAQVASSLGSKTTGFLRHCARCRLPYPQELVHCPACGATEQVDEEDTMTGQLGPESKRSWSVQLLIEVLEKALNMGRPADASRTLHRISTQFDDNAAAGERIDPEQLAAVATLAMRTSALTHDPAHATWCLGLYASLRLLPPVAVNDELALFAIRHAGVLRPVVEELLRIGRASEDGQTERGQDAIARLERLLAAIDGEGGGGAPDETSSAPAVS